LAVAVRSLVTPPRLQKERERVQRVQWVVVKTIIMPKAPRGVIPMANHQTTVASRPLIMEVTPPRRQKERERVQRVQRVVVKTIIMPKVPREVIPSQVLPTLLATDTILSEVTVTAASQAKVKVIPKAASQVIPTPRIGELVNVRKVNLSLPSGNEQTENVNGY
jgi:hypothetical protein